MEGKTSPLFSICNQLKFYTTIQNQFTLQINLLFTMVHVSKSSLEAVIMYFFMSDSKWKYFGLETILIVTLVWSINFFQTKTFQIQNYKQAVEFFFSPPNNPKYFSNFSMLLRLKVFKEESSSKCLQNCLNNNY